MNNKLLEKYSKQNKELVHQISTIFEKAINIIQAKNSEIKSRKTLNSKIIEQKNMKEVFLNKIAVYGVFLILKDIAKKMILIIMI